jgi:drug/metabolite transporter (DMT)-like permease
MSALALAMVLAAALMHATWNLFAKRASGGAAFVWLFSTLAGAIYAPFVVAVLLVERPPIDPGMIPFLVGSPMLNVIYFLLLQRSYRSGDLSLVYPLARGSAPLITTIVAVMLLGERPTLLAAAGTLLITLGVVILSSAPYARRGDRQAVTYGLLTGASIAAYTLWDKYAVGAALVPPLFLGWAIYVGQAVLLAPLALRSWKTVQSEWRMHRREALGVGVLSPLSYVLVLGALVFTPVSYVASAREISILIGVVMGSSLLAEGRGSRRLIAAGAMVVGVIGLAVT